MLSIPLSRPISCTEKVRLWRRIDITCTNHIDTNIMAIITAPGRIGEPKGWRICHYYQQLLVQMQRTKWKFNIRQQNNWFQPLSLDDPVEVDFYCCNVSDFLRTDMIRWNHKCRGGRETATYNRSHSKDLKVTLGISTCLAVPAIVLTC